MTYPDMYLAIKRFFEDRCNEPMSSAAVYEEAFADQDKVRFQLAMSNMYLKSHELVKIAPPDQPSNSTRGALWRLRIDSDAPFVAPPKIPRASRTIEITKPLASPAARPSKIAHRTVGHVAETPPEVRAKEPNHTMPVEHHALGAPPNHALAEALAKAKPKSTFGSIPGRRTPEPVAQFANQKVLQYEIPEGAKVVEVPRGVSGISSTNKGDVKLPQFTVSATAESVPAEARPDTMQIKESAEAMVQVTQQAFDVKPTLQEVFGGLVKDQSQDGNFAALQFAEARYEEPDPRTAKPVRQSAAPLSPGQVIDLLIATVGPLFKSYLKDAIKEALHEAKDQTGPATQEVAVAPALAASIKTTPAAESTISVPPYVEERKAEPERRRAVMPGDLSVATTRLPRLAIIGLTSAQQEWDIKEEFAKWLDIRTIHTDTTTKVVRKMVAAVEHTLVLKDHVNHKIVHALEADNVKYDRVEGGLTRLRDRLREIIQNYQKEVAS